MKDFISNRKILYVDDEVNLLSSFKSLLRKENYEIHLLEDSTKISSVLEQNGPFAVVLSDQRMPGLDGVNLLKKVSEIYPDTIRILVTGFSNHEETIQAVNVGGISRYINKPWNDDDLKKMINSLVKQYNLSSENAFLFSQIKEQKNRLSGVLNGTIAGISALLIDILDHINHHAAEQTNRVKQQGLSILRHFNNLTEEENWEITRAFELFNIGYALIPTWIQVTLNKEGLSAARRFSACKNIYKLASDLLIRIPGFQNVAKIVEDLQGVSNNEVPSSQTTLGTRILKILIDKEMLSTQNYRGNVVLKEFLRYPNKYDPDIIKVLINNSNTGLNKIKNDSVELTLNELKPGMVVLYDVKTKAGVKLIPANSKITSVSLQSLSSWNKVDEIIEPIFIQQG